MHAYARIIGSSRDREKSQCCYYVGIAIYLLIPLCETILISNAASLASCSLPKIRVRRGMQMGGGETFFQDRWGEKRDDGELYLASS